MEFTSDSRGIHMEFTSDSHITHIGFIAREFGAIFLSVFWPAIGLTSVGPDPAHQSKIGPVRKVWSNVGPVRGIWDSFSFII